MVSLTERIKIALSDKVLPGFLFRWRAALKGVPDSKLYNPRFQPWRGPSEFRTTYNAIRHHTLVTQERAWTLYCLARQALSLQGDFVEAGVYLGGTARLLRSLIDTSPSRRRLHLFDTFMGMPETSTEHDHHRAGDFSDTSTEMVSNFVGREDWIYYHKGLIPQTFHGLESARIALSHIDVDIYQSVLDCCEFLYPRTVPGGFLLFDDYGFPSCPGARAAVDEFFHNKPEIPLVLHSGQAAVFKIT
jgi:O-methyltransferase